MDGLTMPWSKPTKPDSGNTIDQFLVNAREASVVSFDLFDTLLVRIFGQPTDLFMAMSERLTAQQISFADGFVQARIQAEQRARDSAKQSGGNEITLASIYAELAAALTADGKTGTADVQWAMDLECELEIASVRPDWQVKQAFDTLVASGVRVVIVSDMYLPLECIEAMLIRSGIRGYLHLFLSSDCDASKANGSIWPYLRDKLALTSEDLIVHLGDNADADGTTARRSGVRSFLLAEPRTRLPTRLLPANGHWFHDSCLALLQQSIARHRDNPKVHPYWLMLAHLVVLPAALGMAAFVRDLADREKTDRIYFLARDGLIFRKAYEAAWRRQSDAESHYVWGSRRCLNVAMIERTDAAALAFLMSGKSALSVADYIRRVDLDPDAPDVLAVIQARFRNPTHIISSESEREMMRAVFRDLEPMTRARAAMEREPLLAHLNGLGLFDSPGVVVDLGWHGTMQRSLIEIGQQCTGNRPRLVGAYLGTFKNRVRIAGDQEMSASGWLFDEDNPMEHATTIRRSLEVVELLFSAPESGIRYLGLREGQIAPVRMVEPEETSRLEIATIIHDAVTSACIGLKPFIESVPREVFKHMALENLECLLATPSTTDTAMFGKIEHAEGFGGKDYKPIIQARPRPANRWSLYDAYNKSFWPIGFRASLNRIDRFKLEAITRLQTIRKQRNRRINATRGLQLGEES